MAVGYAAAIQQIEGQIDTKQEAPPWTRRVSATRSPRKNRSSARRAEGPAAPPGLRLFNLTCFLLLPRHKSSVGAQIEDAVLFLEGRTGSRVEMEELRSSLRSVDPSYDVSSPELLFHHFLHLLGGTPPPSAHSGDALGGRRRRQVGRTLPTIAS